jgi:rod shape-determining protein MreC
MVMFRRNPKNILYLIILLVPFLIFFSRSSFFINARSGMVQLVAGPIRLLSLPLFEIKKILYYHRTFAEYRRLRDMVGELRARLVAQEELLKENARLQKLLDARKRWVYSSVLANVIGRNPSFWNSILIIDRGTADGIEVGMAVVNASGVVGKIAEAGERSSKVVLLTDPGFSVASLAQRTREAALVSGSLSGQCRLRYIDPEADIQPGDQVITSQLSGVFPAGLLVGEVIGVSRESGDGFREYVIRPAAALSQLDEVLVIIK